MSKPGRRTVDRVDYYEYIRSSEWAEVKARYRRSRLPQSCIAVLGKANDKKIVCGAHLVDLHHRTYKNLGNERLMDLVPLCRDHHQAVHDLLKKTVDIDLWVATKLVINGRYKNPVAVRRRGRTSRYGPTRSDRRPWNAIWTSRCPKCGAHKKKCVGLERRKAYFHQERVELILPIS